MARAFPRFKRPGAAADFIDRRLQDGTVGFSLPQLVNATGLSPESARAQLRRLGKRVCQVSPQFFLSVSPEHYVIGAPPVEQWLDDYFAWLGRTYYLALQSAAATYNASPQAIQVTQVITESPRRPVCVGRIKLHFFVKRSAKNTPTQQPPNAFAPIRISVPAATAFDLVRYAPRIGGIEQAIETLGPLLPLIKARDLAVVLKSENEKATAQRLGYLVEKAGRADLASSIDEWLPSKRPATPLVPARSIGTSVVLAPRWHVLDNTVALPQ
jgi:hypothetical protein